MITNFRKLNWRHFLIIAAVVFAAFFPALKSGFLNWDDQTHLTRNTQVLSFDLKGIFSYPVQDIYIPLTSLSFAVEKAAFGLNPLVFHLDNILLHIAVACLLMGLFARMGASGVASFLGALLFALHPMHVESVAWVTERKDVLYALFYVFALRQWWAYLDRRESRGFWLTGLWVLLSLLAKPMAVSLPFVLLFMEWWKKGSVRHLRWMAYLPFMALSTAIGWMTYMHHVRNPVIDPGVSILIWLWTLAFYIWKFFLPFIFHPLYAMPTPVGLFEAPYLGAVVLVILIAWSLIRVAHNHGDRWLLLAAGFFFVSIFLVLRFDAHDVHVVADRFMYLPSAFICLWLGIKAEGLMARYGRLVLAGIIVLIVALGIRTFTYTAMWQESVSLWSYVIKYYPYQEIAYNNRAVAYGDKGQYDLAIKDNTTVLGFPSNRALAFYNRGVSYRDWGLKFVKEKDMLRSEKLFLLAKADFDAAIQQDQLYARTYNHRGMVRFYLHDLTGALEDLTKAIERDPEYIEAYNNRGNLRSAAGALDLALSDYRRVIELGSFTAEAYSNMGIIYARKGYPDLAVQYFEKAMQVNPRHGEAYFNRSVIRLQQGNLAGAREDADKARRLGISLSEAYLKTLQR